MGDQDLIDPNLAHHTSTGRKLSSCHEHCDTCDSNVSRYEHCTQCKSTHWGQELDGGNSSYVFCTDYCPTGFTDSKPICTPPADPIIASWTFTSTAGLTSNGHTITPHNTEPSASRGMYFDGSTSYCDVSTIRMPMASTVNIWIFMFDPDGANSNYTWFDKYLGGSLYMRFKKRGNGCVRLNLQ